MNKKILLLPAAAACMAVALADKSDPIVMTVGDIQVPRSEFEYLYKKNAQQQLGEQSIDEYAELFKLYKMKVADALAEGLDTTSAFLNEFRGYRAELSASYLTDSAYIYSLMREAYGRLDEDVEAIHIMKFKQPSLAGNLAAQAQLDSLRNVILSGGDYAALAQQYSEDKGSSDRGGNMGYITSMQYPYNFETAAYNLKEGEISHVIESPQGFHLLKGGKHRPARGEVLASHILLLVPRDASSEDAEAISNRIDSIYGVAVAGGDFEQLARSYSQDPGSAGKGGNLGWFGSGRMVHEFDSVAFAINVGEVSRPFRTNYGWHIIKKIDTRGHDSFEAMKPQLLQAVTRPQDARQGMINERYVKSLRDKYHYREFPEVETELLEYAAANGIDSVFFRRFYENSEFASKVVFTFDGGSPQVGDFLKSILKYSNTKNPDAAKQFLEVRLLSWKNDKLYRHEEDGLVNIYPEFRNLVNEYHDGMLLFEVSNRKVWEKAAQDSEGLKNFFEKNRADYSWNSPHVKGYLIQTKSPEISDSIKMALKDIPASDVARFVQTNFKNDAKIERVLAKKGDNPIVDYLAFGVTRNPAANSKFSDCFLYDCTTLEQPEELNDVRVQVTGDYQNVLEEEWISTLRGKYPVKVNEKEFKKMKREMEKKK